jgi:hypothetical protein
VLLACWSGAGTLLLLAEAGSGQESQPLRFDCESRVDSPDGVRRGMLSEFFPQSWPLDQTRCGSLKREAVHSRTRLRARDFGRSGVQVVNDRLIKAASVKTHSPVMAFAAPEDDDIRRLRRSFFGRRVPKCVGATAAGRGKAFASGPLISRYYTSGYRKS